MARGTRVALPTASRPLGRTSLGDCMAKITFYEKPGCGGNAKQQALLIAAGHELEVRNLLDHPWTNSELLRFLRDLPVPAWFNRAASKIKAGELVPESLTHDQALAALRRDPLLIRRPLMECAGTTHVGFDATEVHAWVGLGVAELPSNLEGCAPAAHPRLANVTCKAPG